MSTRLMERLPAGRQDSEHKSLYELILEIF